VAGTGRMVVLALVLLAAACTGGGGRSAAPRSGTTVTTAPSSGCRTSASEPPGTSERTMVSGGVERTYQLTIPPTRGAQRPLPVVLGLHALSISFRLTPGLAGFGDEAAARHDFIGVAPSGLVDGATPYWIAAPVEGNRDVRFIADLLTQLEDQLCVDTGRIYATGMSNGGQMSSVLACQLPEEVTAVAPVAGVEFSEGCRGRPVPVLAFHGTADPIVTYEGGGLNARAIADTYAWHGDVPDGVPEHHGVDAAMRTWAAHNGCDGEPVEERAALHVVHRTWRHCEADTELYVVEGGGHAWPGKPVPQFEATFGPGTTEIDATTLIFEFFFAQDW
jgi:polyhydroxybutyrate depolymerase